MVILFYYRILKKSTLTLIIRIDFYVTKLYIMSVAFIFGRRLYLKKHKDRFLNNNQLQLYSLCAIPIIQVFIFSYLPMFGVIMAFKDYRFDKGILGSEWVGLRNFTYFFTSNDFWVITRNTLFLNGIFILFGTISSLILAIALFEVIKKVNIKIYQTIMITPHFLSWVVVGYMAYALLNPEFGMINTMLKNMNMGTVPWYTKPNVWPIILSIASVWKGFGMDSVIYYACLMGIDETLFEAARIDGASRFQIIKKIIIPSLIPLITILIILKIGNIFRADFGLFYQLTRDVGELYSTTDVIDTYIFRTMRVIGDMSLSSAVGLLQAVVGFVLVLTTNYISGKIDPDNTLL